MTEEAVAVAVVEIAAAEVVIMKIVMKIVKNPSIMVDVDVVLHLDSYMPVLSLVRALYHCIMSCRAVECVSRITYGGRFTTRLQLLQDEVRWY